MNRKGFQSEYAANEFAKEVHGKVEFRPLSDYMGMIPYWVVIWEENKQAAG